jgi:hypothetical protein
MCVRIQFAWRDDGPAPPDFTKADQNKVAVTAFVINMVLGGNTKNFV